MPSRWITQVFDTGELRVHNKAGRWSAAANKAITTFNGLGFGVTLVPERDETKANVVVMLSATGSDSYKYDRNPNYQAYTINAKFAAEKLHGYTGSLKDGNTHENVFAAIYLPGKVKGVTEKQKEVVIVHELIHAAGVDGGRPDGTQDPGQDHDIEGVMVANMKVHGDGLLEYMPMKGARPMTPIRVGARTRCTIMTLWDPNHTC